MHTARVLAILISAPLVAQQIILLRPHEKTDPTAPSEKLEERGTGGVIDRSISGVSQPSITVYLPAADAATGTGIVICPGGGYQHLAIDKEGHDIARWLNTLGIAGIVLKYRLPGSANMRAAMGDLEQARTAAKVAIEDAQETMRIVRARAAEWKLKPNHIGIMGFSAGGHLAAMLGMLAPPETRPDFFVLGYPAIPQTLQVTSATPPTFIVQAADDPAVPPERHAVRFFVVLKEAKVPVEMLIYSSGGRGFGIRKTGKTSSAWPAEFAAWLKEMKY